MEITDIILQKNKKFYNLYADGSFLCTVDEEIIYYHNLSKGKIIDGEEVIKISEESLGKKAFNQGVYYLSIKMRTEKEVIKYLQNKDYSSKIINSTIDKLKGYGYIDDDNYAVLFIKSRINSGYTRKKIYYKLNEKGINETKVIEFLNEFYPDTLEQNNLTKEMNKLNLKYKNLPFRDKTVKITQSLMGKGYKIEDITGFIDKVITEENNDDHFKGRLIKLVDEYTAKYKKKGYSSREIKQRVMQSLYRKGYDYDTIKKYVGDTDI